MSRPALGLASGIGLVSANMIGTGVFLSAGFMAQTMGPGLILAAWGLGLVLALAGARVYAEAARLVPRSGGEYRFLGELLHPALGYVAGWISLLVGFAAPTAINALGAASFLATVVALPDARLVATFLIVGLTWVHAVGLDASRWTQDGFAALKLALVIGFVVVGLALGAHDLPSWPELAARPPGDAARAFLASQFFVAFAYSGWNAAVYLAEEFRDPRRDVGRSMLIGCLVVGALYLAVNFVLVANVSPTAAVADDAAATTLGHVVAGALLGEVGAGLMSIVVALIFASAASAMTLVGPRVTAAMASEGDLAAGLAARPGRPPARAIVLQGAIAIAVIWSHGLRGALETVGALLTLSNALVCVAILRVALRPGGRARPAPAAVVAAIVHVAVSSWMLSVGLRAHAGVALAAAAAIVVALGAARVVGRRRAPRA